MEGINYTRSVFDTQGLEHKIFESMSKLNTNLDLIFVKGSDINHSAFLIDSKKGEIKINNEITIINLLKMLLELSEKGLLAENIKDNLLKSLLYIYKKHKGENNNTRGFILIIINRFFGNDLSNKIRENNSIVDELIGEGGDFFMYEGGDLYEAVKMIFVSSFFKSGEEKLREIETITQSRLLVLKEETRPDQINESKYNSGSIKEKFLDKERKKLWEKGNIECLKRGLDEVRAKGNENAIRAYELSAANKVLKLVGEYPWLNVEYKGGFLSSVIKGDGMDCEGFSILGSYILDYLGIKNQGLLMDNHIALMLSIGGSIYLFDGTLDPLPGSKPKIREFSWGDEDSSYKSLVFKDKKIKRKYSGVVDSNVGDNIFIGSNLGDLAAQYLAKGRIKEAKKAANLSLQFFSKNKNPYEILYAIYLNESNLEKAQEMLQNLFDLGLPNYDAYMLSGRLEEKKGNFKKALLEYKQAITRRTNNIQAHIRLFVCYVKLKDTNNAYSEFNNIIKRLGKISDKDKLILFNSILQVDLSKEQRENVINLCEKYNMACLIITPPFSEN